jgi:HSP20 family protein
MDSLLSSLARSSRQPAVPAFEVVEDADKVTLQADVPGLDASAIDIQVEGDRLSVEWERRQAKSKRSFRLAPTVDAQGITADLKSGVLTLTLPKRPEAQPRQIKVTVKS